MSELKIINYRGFEVNVKTPAIHRSDRKYTVKAMLTKQEKRVLNTVMFDLGYDTVLDFVSMAVTSYLHLAITETEIESAKRRLRDQDGIQVNGRLYEETYTEFRRVQAENNLNQRQLTYVLINKAVQLAGYKLP